MRIRNGEDARGGRHTGSGEVCGAAAGLLACFEEFIEQISRRSCIYGELLEALRRGGDCVCHDIGRVTGEGE